MSSAPSPAFDHDLENAAGEVKSYADMAAYCARVLDSSIPAETKSLFCASAFLMLAHHRLPHVLNTSIAKRSAAQVEIGVTRVFENVAKVDLATEEGQKKARGWRTISFWWITLEHLKLDGIRRKNPKSLQEIQEENLESGHTALQDPASSEKNPEQALVTQQTVARVLQHAQRVVTKAKPRTPKCKVGQRFLDSLDGTGSPIKDQRKTADELGVPITTLKNELHRLRVKTREFIDIDPTLGGFHPRG